MPQYEFHCGVCGAEFEVSRPVSRSGPVSCPADGSAALMFSMFGDGLVVGRRGMATGERLLPRPVWSSFQHSHGDGPGAHSH